MAPEVLQPRHIQTASSLHDLSNPHMPPQLNDCIIMAFLCSAFNASTIHAARSDVAVQIVHFDYSPTLWCITPPSTSLLPECGFFLFRFNVKGISCPMPECGTVALPNSERRSPRVPTGFFRFRHQLMRSRVVLTAAATFFTCS